MQLLAEKRVIERSVAAAQADLRRNQREYQLQVVKTNSDSAAALAGLQQTRLNLQKAESDLRFAKIDRDRYQQLSEVGAVSRRDFDQKKLLVEQSQLRLQAEQKAINVAQAKLKAAQAAMNPSMAVVAIARQRIAQEIARGEATIATLIKEKEALIQRQVELNSQLQQYDKEIALERMRAEGATIATSESILFELCKEAGNDTFKTISKLVK